MRQFLTPALLAGLLAALILSLVQTFWVTPLILQAETYENGPAPVADHHAAAPDHHAAAAEAKHHHDAPQAEHAHAVAVPEDHHAAGAGHEHDPQAWAPEDGWQRTLATAGANLVMGVGYGLMLLGCYQLRRPQGLRGGLLYGLAGFAVAFGAPSLGLPPELPGTEAADLVLRQSWWLGTAVATAGGLYLLSLRRGWAFNVAAVLLLGAPHLIGAPQPAVHQALAPETLQQQFVLASALVNLLFWLVLGGASAWLFNRHAQAGEMQAAR